MTDTVTRTRLSAIAERLRDEETRLERLIDRETDSFRIEELDYALKVIGQSATVLENLSVPESEEAVLVRNLSKSAKLVADNPQRTAQEHMDALREAREGR